jgi:hypothetical protein
MRPQLEGETSLAVGFLLGGKAVTQQGSDVITQAQDSLDKPKETSTEPKYVTVDEFQKMQARVDAAESQNRGLQARVDKDRTDRQREEHVRAAQVRKSRLVTQMGQADETNRPLFESQIASEDERIATLSQPTTEPTSTNGPAAATGDTQWEPVYEIVRNLGLDPQDKRIDYSPLTRPGIDDASRLGTFMAGVRPLVGAIEQTASPQKTNTTVSPPTGGSPSTGGARTSAQEVRLSFISGELNYDQTQTELKRFGESLPSPG